MARSITAEETGTALRALAEAASTLLVQARSADQDASAAILAKRQRDALATVAERA
jgi:hypothetical protein